MMITKKAIVGLVVVVVAVGVFGLLYLSRNPPSTPSPGKYIGDGELFLSSPPALGQTATLTYIVENLTGITPRMRLSVRIGLQEGFIWLEDSIPGKRLIWENRYLVENVYFPENEMPERIEVSGVIKAVGTGRWNITAFTLPAAGADNTLLSTDNLPPDWRMNGPPSSIHEAGAVINITVSEDSAQVEEGWYYPPKNYENVGVPSSAAPASEVNLFLAANQS